MNENTPDFKDEIVRDAPVVTEEGKVRAAESDENGRPMKYTYSRELEKRGMTRRSAEYMRAIEMAFFWVRQNRSYYGFVLDEMTRIVTHDLPTMAVTVGSNGINLLINPDFAALLSTRHCAGVLQHECLHVMMRHLTRMRAAHKKHPGKWQMLNVAADLAVNSLLADPRDLPKSALLPNKFRVPLANKLPKDWPFFPMRETFETYVDLLTTNDISDQLKGMGGDGDLQPDQGSDDVTIDHHDEWQHHNEMDEEILDEIIREKMRSATRKAAGRGIHPGDCKSVLDELLKEKTVDFSRLFRGVMGRFTSYVRERAPMSVSRRTKLPPGRRQGKRLKIWFYQDTSGSMSDEEVQIGLSEALHAHNSGLAEVTVQQFDAQLQGPAKLITAMGKVGVEVKGRGGTSLAPVVADIDKQDVDLVIIATDGGLEHNLKPKSAKKVVWILTSNGLDPGWGQALRLPSRAEIEAGKRAKQLR